MMGGMFETPISLSGVFAPLARVGFCVIPRPLRHRRFFGNAEIRLNADPLRRQFDAIVAEGDRHGQWLALRRSAALLDRLAIPHPGTEAGPDVWRAFLAHVIDAAEDGDMDRARQARETYGFVAAPADFGAPTGAPYSEDNGDGPVGIEGPPIGEVPTTKPSELEADTTAKESQVDGPIPLADAIVKAWEIEEIRRLPEFVTLASDRPQDVLRRLAERIFDGSDPNLSIRGVIGNPPIEQTVEHPHEYDFENDLTEMNHMTGDGRRYRELRIRWSDIERSVRRRLEPDD